MSNAIFAAFGTEPKSPYEETPMNIFASCIVCGLMFEIAFFFGHYLEHVLPTAYRKYHLLHHTTKADTAISGYYMTGRFKISWAAECFRAGAMCIPVYFLPYIVVI